MESMDLMDKRLEDLEKKFQALQEKNNSAPEGISILVFSNDMDKFLVALHLACASLAMGLPTSLFFTFWGVSILKKKGPQNANKLFLQKMFSWMMPKGLEGLSISKMNYMGVGRKMMDTLMKQCKKDSPQELFEAVIEGGADIYVCSNSMEMMGLKEDELVPISNLQFAGATKFINQAEQKKLCFFI